MATASKASDYGSGNRASNDVRSFRVLPSQAPCHTLDEKADGYDPQHVQERLEMLIHDLRNSLSGALGYMQIVVHAAHEETKEDFETCVLESLSPMQSALWRVDILIQEIVHTVRGGTISSPRSSSRASAPTTASRSPTSPRRMPVE